MAREECNPIDLAARALQSRDRSRREIDERLERAGVGSEERAEALETLERVGYLDDVRFATARASVLAGRGYGDAYIASDLEEHGVSPECLAGSLAGLDPEHERARALAAKLGRTPRTAARLARKGFSEESLEGFVAGNDEVS